MGSKIYWCIAFIAFYMSYINAMQYHAITQEADKIDGEHHIIQKQLDQLSQDIKTAIEVDHRESDLLTFIENKFQELIQKCKELEDACILRDKIKSESKCLSQDQKSLHQFNKKFSKGELNLIDKCEDIQKDLFILNALLIYK